MPMQRPKDIVSMYGGALEPALPEPAFDSEAPAEGDDMGSCRLPAMARSNVALSMSKIAPPEQMVGINVIVVLCRGTLSVFWALLHVRLSFIALVSLGCHIRR